jgi:flagellar biosynthesis/type III secretory pathway M-ring protein FliF/YscJ
VTGIVLLTMGVAGPHSTQAFATSGGTLMAVGIIVLVASIICSKKLHPRISVEPGEEQPEQQNRDSEGRKEPKKEKKRKKKLRKSRKEIVDVGKHSELAGQ